MIRVQKRPPLTEQQKEARRVNMAKATQARLAKQRIKKNQGRLLENDDPYPNAKPPKGHVWMMDEVISAVLSGDDAVESRRITQAMIKEANNGNVNAAHFLADRAQGRPVQKVQVAGGLSIGLLDDILEPPPSSQEEK